MRVLRDIVSLSAGTKWGKFALVLGPWLPEQTGACRNYYNINTKPSESEEQRHGRGDLLGGGGGPGGAGGAGDPVLGAGGEEAEQGDAGQEEAQTQAQAAEQPDTLWGSQVSGSSMSL